jgi:hypothetical protein
MHSDWVEIANVVAGLAHAQDDKDWARLRRLFADPATLDLSARSGEPAATMTAEALTATARRVLEGFACTHHASSNPLVEIDGEDRRTTVERVHRDPAFETSIGVRARELLAGEAVTVRLVPTAGSGLS